MDDTQRLLDLNDLHALKARYFRALDTKDWPSLRAVFADDLVYYRDPGYGEPSAAPSVVGADAFLENVKRRHSTSVTVHHGHGPEIQLTGDDTATGVWALFDWVDNYAEGHAWKGYGHYHEHYLKGTDGRWRIKEMRLSRVRVDAVQTTDPREVQRGIDVWAGGKLPAGLNIDDYH